MNALLLSTEEIADMLNLCRSSFYSLHSAGKIGPMPIHLNRRTLWSVKEFERWIFAGYPNREKWQKIRAAEIESVAQ